MQLLAMCADSLRTAYAGCPLCGGAGSVVRTEDSGRGSVRCLMTWLKCEQCGHVHSSHYFNEVGLKHLLAVADESGLFGGAIDEQRVKWSQVIERILRYGPGETWVDVGVGNGGLLFTAAEYGFDVRGIDLRPFVIAPLRQFGYNVELADAMDYDYSGVDVVVLADILEHVPYPKELLTRIRSQKSEHGALFVSCPNMDTVSWRCADSADGSPYWNEIEHCHNFTRARLELLLRECGFTPVQYGVSQRYTSCMEIIAI